MSKRFRICLNKNNWQTKDLEQLKSIIKIGLKKYPLENLRAEILETASKLNVTPRESINRPNASLY